MVRVVIFKLFSCKLSSLTSVSHLCSEIQQLDDLRTGTRLIDAEIKNGFFVSCHIVACQELISLHRQHIKNIVMRQYFNRDLVKIISLFLFYPDWRNIAICVVLLGKLFYSNIVTIYGCCRPD
uniref:Secreted protein n=1 Tax=Anopheles dirus TaxID=7168 RepID=A0A182NYR5_9DIPT